VVLGILMVVVHVLTVFLLVGGIVGRDLTYWQAVRTNDLGRLRHYVDLAHSFEMLVRVMTGWVLVAGLGAAWARGWPILGLHHGPHWVLAAMLIFLTIVPWIVFVFVPSGRVFRAALADAILKNDVTPELKAALADPQSERGACLRADDHRGAHLADDRPALLSRAISRATSRAVARAAPDRRAERRATTFHHRPRGPSRCCRSR
jgi:hypothetical protein